MSMALASSIVLFQTLTTLQLAPVPQHVRSPRTCTMSRVRPIDLPKQWSHTTQPLQGAL